MADGKLTSLRGGGYPHGSNKTTNPVALTWLWVKKSWSKG